MSYRVEGFRNNDLGPDEDSSSVYITEGSIDVSLFIETQLDKGPEEKLWKRRTLMKWAKDKAVVAAFEKVLLIVLGNGKVAVEHRTDQEEILSDENVEGILQLSALPLRLEHYL
ncbi:RAD52 motif-containing protein 1 [Silurus asotus]|uniref:RAD52 motif-containing protein 1 n=1 Tax=Silurus asotus TaxID=30991 RepID=A0AAD5F8X6_SILAS|nr:RAD52 motif-containing protein 1 [Silurus asotus]